MGRCAPISIPANFFGASLILNCCHHRNNMGRHTGRHYTVLVKQLAKFVHKLPRLDGADAFDPAAARI